jgi:putative ATPase
MLTPLAERMRPQNLDDIIGQAHLTAPGTMLHQAVNGGYLPSLILWGPPGVGKTTLAIILAKSVGLPFFQLSAISSGVKEIREAIDQAVKVNGAVLFIDEIHRFNKSQQDALLGAVEKGIIRLIGATTENPSFEVNSALLSRCQVLILKSLAKEDLLLLIHKAISTDKALSKRKINITETEALLRLSGGDARKLLNILEMVAGNVSNTSMVITDDLVMSVVQQKMALYDKNGEQHYDIISAFIKSIRGSDPNAGVYWLARMIEGGEDLSFIARRLVILASEDIGNANPNALLLANATFEAVIKIGYPEARIILSQCVIYLSTSPKSNTSYNAINDALDLVRKTGDLPVPLHLRNAPTKMMREQGYGKDYAYSHLYEQSFSEQEYLPENISGYVFYKPGNNRREEEMRQFLKERWKNKYNF